MYTDSSRSIGENSYLAIFYKDTRLLTLLQRHKENHCNVLLYFLCWHEENFLKLNVNRRAGILSSFPSGYLIQSLLSVSSVFLSPVYYVIILLRLLKPEVPKHCFYCQLQLNVNIEHIDKLNYSFFASSQVTARKENVSYFICHSFNFFPCVPNSLSIHDKNRLGIVNMFLKLTCVRKRIQIPVVISKQSKGHSTFSPPEDLNQQEKFFCLCQINSVICLNAGNKPTK